MSARLLLLVVACAFGFRLFDGDTEEYKALFVPYERGLAGQVDLAENWMPERVNEGSPTSQARASNQWAAAPERQICPGMVGPVGDDRYYCRGKEYGYCDRRTGACHCKTGYQGIECGECTPTHYAEGGLCYSKRLCPNECSGNGVCDYSRGECDCLAHRVGLDCSLPQCRVYDPLCEQCSNSTCVKCAQGFYVDSGSSCKSCSLHDPRCSACSEEECLECADPLLLSIRRSGQRGSVDSDLPPDELVRELGLKLEFGTQRQDAFDEAEAFRVVNIEAARRCDQGFGGAAWNCSLTDGSHVVCGHEGTISWDSPSYSVAEAGGHVRLTLRRTGGGVGVVSFSYSLRHLTTDASDVSATAHYTTSQTLTMDAGVVEVSFLLAVHDDRFAEADERCQVELHGPLTGGVVIGPQRTTILTILDDDAYRAAAAHSRLRGDWFAVAGQSHDFIIAAYSAACQRMRTGGDRFIVQVEPLALLTDDDTYFVSGASRRVEAAIVDVGDGSYEGTYTSLASGQFRARSWLAIPGGLRGEYYSNSEVSFSRVDAQVLFEAWPPAPDVHNVKWSGRLVTAVTETHYLHLNASSSFGCRLWLDGRLLVDAWNDDDWSDEAAVDLEADRLHTMVLELKWTTGDYFSLDWSSASLTRQPIPSTALFYVDKLPVTNASTYMDNGRESKRRMGSVAVVSGATSATETYATGLNLYAADAGQQFTFSVHLCDAFGNLRDDVSRLTGPETVDARNFDPTATSVQELTNDALKGLVAKMTLLPDITLVAALEFDAETGVVTGYLVPTVAGVYELEITFEANTTRDDYYSGRRLTSSEDIGGSPFSVTVSPAAKSLAANSYVRGTGRKKATAGEPTYFTVTAVDALGNDRTEGGEIVEVLAKFDFEWGTSMDWSRVKEGDFSDWETHELARREDFAFLTEQYGEMSMITTGEVTYNGSYTAVYVPTIAGDHLLYVTLDGLGVYGSPFALVVKAAEPLAAATTAEGPGLLRAKVSVLATIYVTARDPHGNPNYEPLTCQIRGATNSTEDGSTLVDYGNGTAALGYVPMESGESLLDVYLDGDHIYGSPFAVWVEEGDVNETKTTADGDGLFNAQVGYNASFVLKVYDDGSNRVASDVHTNFSLSISGEPAAFTVESMGVGRYLVVYNATVAGSAELLEVLSSETHVRGSPFSVFVRPGDVSGPVSTATGRGISPNVVACELQEVTISARDAFGNHRIDEDDRVFMSVRDEQFENFTVEGLPLGVGRYDLSYVPRVTGEHTAQVFVLEKGLDAFAYAQYDLSLLRTRRVVSTIATFHDSELPLGFFSVRFVGRLDFNGIYNCLFKIATDDDSAAALYIDGELITTTFRPKNEVTHFELTYQHSRGSAPSLELFWKKQDEEWSLVPSSAFFRSKVVGDQTFNYEVVPGPTVPGASTLVYSEEVASAEWHRFTLESRDACGNLRQSGGEDVALLMLDQQEEQRAVVTDNENGTYSLDFLVDRAGDYSLSAVVGLVDEQQSRAQLAAHFIGSHAQNSPATLKVHPGSASARTSTLAGAPVIKGVVAGEVSTAYIEARDATYNDATGETLETMQIAVSLKLRQKSRLAGISQDARDVNASITKITGARYGVEFVLEVAGTYDLLVTLRGQPLAGSLSPSFLNNEREESYTVVCLASRVATAHSGAWGVVPLVQQANVTAAASRRFLVIARDAFGNDLNVGGSWFRVHLRGPKRRVGFAVDNGDGSYSVKFATDGLQEGEYEIHVNVMHSQGMLLGHYFDNQNLAGVPTEVREEPLSASLVKEHASVRWTGFLASPFSSDFTFQVTVGDAKDTTRLFIDGTLIAQTTTLSAESAALSLERGAIYAITVEYEHDSSLSRTASALSLRWSSDELLANQPVSAYYLFPSMAQPIAGSPFPLTLASLNASTTNSSAIFYSAPTPPDDSHVATLHEDGSVTLLT